jgi:hypothetical protein
MGNWVPCGERFIVGDVIRWTEPIWHESRKKKNSRASSAVSTPGLSLKRRGGTEPQSRKKKTGKKAVEKIGERRVTAEVLAIDAHDYVSLSVCACEIVSKKDGWALEPFKKKQVIRKKRSTIGKGSGERLKWSEEGARSLAASKFLR